MHAHVFHGGSVTGRHVGQPGGQALNPNPMPGTITNAMPSQHYIIQHIRSNHFRHRVLMGIPGLVPEVSVSGN